MKAKILVFTQGQQISELELLKGNEYIIGRSDSCDIQLEQERGISRQHLKISEVNGNWQVDVLSKFGGLHAEGTQVNSLTLAPDCSFSLPPYEFQYVSKGARSEKMEQGQDEISLSISRTNSLAEGSEQSITAALTPEEISKTPVVKDDTDDTSGDFESTLIGRIKLVPHLKIVNEKHGSEEVLRLEGDIWTAGRSRECEIYINDPNISRSHFEIRRTKNQYSITDLGSSNGTLLNGEALTPTQPYNLKSGDEIVVKQVHLEFQVRDASFDSKVAKADNLPAPIPVGTQTKKIRHDKKRVEKVSGNKLSAILETPVGKAGLGIIAVALIAFNLFDEDVPPPHPNMTSLPSENPVSPEQMKQAKSHFELAVNHLKNRKYQLCLSQIELVHKVVPIYKNSQEIQNQCQQGIDVEKQLADQERIERERERVENKIHVTVENCKSKMTAQTTSDELRACLEPATELNPEHPDIINLITEIKVREDQERERQAAKQARARRLAEGRRRFKVAESLKAKPDFKAALKAYRNFVRGNFALPNENKIAKQSIIDIEKSIKVQLEKATSDCKNLVEQNKYKDAVIACDLVLKDNPGYSEALNLRARALGLLQKQMKSIWEESVLTESYGNIEAAKEKWLKIKSESLPADEFYKKARDKLRKYGADF